MDFSDFKDELTQFKADLPPTTPKKMSPRPKKGSVEIPRQIVNIPRQRRSKAPYNFVPVNERVVWAEYREVKDFQFFNEFNTSKHTGHIELEIQCLGDTFIGHKSKFSDFFSINNTLVIPGSSLRGLIRTYVEILCFGKFGFFDDRHLYFRTFASNSEVLRDLYNNRTKGEDPDTWVCKNISAGYLKKKGAAYYICPAQAEEESDSRYERYLENETLDHYTWKKIEDQKHIIRSGRKIKNKKHDIWLIYPPDKEAEAILLKDSDIKSFRNDLKRGGDKDTNNLTDLIALLDKADDSSMLIPCFYVKDENEKGDPLISFGHTKLFRLMYLHSLSHCLPDTHFENPEAVDIAEAIFGRGEENPCGEKITPLAGRIFFEDAKSSIKISPSDLPQKELRLLGPNPTTIQHYLVQESHNIDELAHYDSSNARLRGNKLYWHKEPTYHTEEFNENMDIRIKPVSKGMCFSGKIRFENLSGVELGAVLSALQLPEGCHHKIGMGKSKGLGSISIKPTLYLSDRQQRYTDLFGDLDCKPETDFQQFCNDFNQYVLQHIKENTLKSIWDTDRLTQFKLLLTVNHNISAQEIEDQDHPKKFSEKKILPLPKEIFKE